MPPTDEPPPTLASLARHIRRAADDAARLHAHTRLLLADFCACVAGGSDDVTSEGWLEDGTAGRIAVLAMRSHARDRDDLDWTTIIHPGSVIWPVVVGLAPADAVAELSQAAVAGYEAAAVVAGLLGPGASGRWHLTAIAGHAAAAAAAAVLLELDDEQFAAALGLALSSAGGLALSASQRTSATLWHRAAAAVGGLHAARAARAGIRPPVDLLRASGGILSTFGSPIAASGRSGHVPAITRVSVRLYPTNGFAQSAVHAAARVRRSMRTVPHGARISVSRQVAAATASAGPGGKWWDLRSSVAVALLTGDEWHVDSAELATEAERIGLLDRVVVEPKDAALHATSVTTSEGISVSLDAPPGLNPVDCLDDLRRKWAGMPISGTATPEEMADSILAQNGRDVAADLAY